MEHLSEETLKRFAAGTASREEGKAVVAHLLKGCAGCARKLRPLIDGELLEAMETSFDPEESRPRFPDLGLPGGGRDH